MLRDCVVDIPRGLFTDQKWIDLVPGMYDGVAVERDPGWNVAYWNLNHRTVTRADDGAARVNGQPAAVLPFFRICAGGRSCRASSRIASRWRTCRRPVRALIDDYASDLARNGIEECRGLPYAFGRFRNGEPIPDLVRRCYREEFPWNEPHPDLWSAEGQAFVIDWLNRPAPEYGRAPWLTRLAATLYRLRPDVQAAFPDVGGKHGESYAHWFVEQASTQERFPLMFVAPVQAALEGRRGASATAKEDAASTAIAIGIRAETADGVPVVVHEAAEPERRTHPLRGAYQVAYRVAWGIRRAVKPLTTQAFRHRVRHALLRKAYFDDSYETPPLVTAAGSLAPAGAAATSKYPAHLPKNFSAFEEDDRGVNVVGYLAAESGIGESARSMLRILKAAGIPVAPINFRLGNLSRMHESIPGVTTTEHLHAINLFHINADQMFVARDGLGASLLEGRYNIGFWAWELQEFPDAWVPAFDLLDEVWVPSAFCQQAIAVKSPVPVLRVPYSVEAPPQEPDRARFGIASDEIAFFAMCDVLQRARTQESAGRRRGLSHGVSGARAGASVSQDRQPRIPAGLEVAARGARAGGCAHHARRGLSRAVRPVGADGEHRLFRVAASGRGVRTRDGRSDGVRQGGHRHGLVGQRRFHARRERAAGRLPPGRTAARSGSVSARSGMGGSGYRFGGARDATDRGVA